MKKATKLALSLLSGIILPFSCVVAPQTQAFAAGQVVAQRTRSQAVLTLQDIPPGFQELDSEQLKRMLQDRIQGGTVKSLSWFLQEDMPFAWILAGTVLPPPGSEKDVVRVMRDTFLRGMSSAIPQIPQIPGSVMPELVQVRELENVNNIGDASAGWIVEMKLRDFPYRTNLVIFRRGGEIGFVAVNYRGGNRPPVSVGELARKLDARMLQYSR